MTRQTNTTAKLFGTKTPKLRDSLTAQRNPSSSTAMIQALLAICSLAAVSSSADNLESFANPFICLSDNNTIIESLNGGYQAALDSALPLMAAANPLAALNKDQTACMAALGTDSILLCMDGNVDTKLFPRLEVKGNASSAVFQLSVSKLNEACVNQDDNRLYIILASMGGAAALIAIMFTAFFLCRSRKKYMAGSEGRQRLLASRGTASSTNAAYGTGNTEDPSLSSAAEARQIQRANTEDPIGTTATILEENPFASSGHLRFS